MVMQMRSCIFKSLNIQKPLRIYWWGTWFRNGIEIFSHWQKPARLDLYLNEDGVAGVKYREERGNQKESQRKRERKPHGV